MGGGKLRIGVKIYRYSPQRAVVVDMYTEMEEEVGEVDMMGERGDYRRWRD
jgi:hypothetical protein